MIKHYYSKPQTIDRIRAHWLGEPIERYVTWMHDQGYVARNVFRRVPLLLHFGDYAQAHGAKAWSDLPPLVQGFVEDWVREHGGDCRTERARKRVVNTVRGPTEQMLRLLLPDFAGTGRGRPFPFSDQAPGFLAHLREERGLRPATLLGYRHCLQPLEVYLSEIKANSVTELSPPILSAFVTARSARWGRSMLQSLCSVLRVFLLYIYREKLIPQDLSASVEAPRQYRLSSIPRSISWAEVERMLAAVDRRSAVGKGRSFESLTAQNLFLSDWEKNVADTRIHGTIRQQVGQFFEAVERPALQPLRTYSWSRICPRPGAGASGAWTSPTSCLLDSSMQTSGKRGS